MSSVNDIEFWEERLKMALGRGGVGDYGNRIKEGL